MTTVAAIQLGATANRDKNLARAEALVRDAAAQGARLVVLPEIFSAPFVAPEPDLEYFEWAERSDGPSNTMVRSVSAELGITVMSPIFEASDLPGVYHNSTYTFRRGELVHVYRKSHLPFSNGFPEKFFFRPGDQPPSVFSDGDLTVGTIICYERHFPELVGSSPSREPTSCASRWRVRANPPRTCSSSS